MSSKTADPVVRSAAWRISLWAALAYACGTMLVFIFLHGFVASDIQRRSDDWLSGEVEVLGDVAERTPKNALYDRVVEEVAELASKEVPNKRESEDSENDSVFFLQTGSDGTRRLWVGAGNGTANLKAIQSVRILPGHPSDIHVQGFDVPFRVASLRLGDGSNVYLGLSERDELRVLKEMRLHFIMVALLLDFFGFGIVFFTTQRMLSHVLKISEVASGIGQSDLSSRVPVLARNDEVAHLALAFNRMLDRIESSMRQLHTITDSLAHDLRSPLTAIRGKLEISLTGIERDDQTEPIIAAIEELDRLSEFLNKSLDVAEAKADALRLNRTPVDLNELLKTMMALYEPSMAAKDLRMHLHSTGSVTIEADAALLHRMIANLFDNELKHLPPARTATIALQAEDGLALVVLEDDGPGFNAEVLAHLFEQRVKGNKSTGHGLGMAFIDAVARSHGGSVSAANRETGGVRITIELPLASSCIHRSNPQ